MKRKLIPYTSTEPVIALRWAQGKWPDSEFTLMPAKLVGRLVKPDPGRTKDQENGAGPQQMDLFADG